jgi:hypothetical protein
MNKYIYIKVADDKWDVYEHAGNTSSDPFYIYHASFKDVEAAEKYCE